MMKKVLWVFLAGLVLAVSSCGYDIDDLGEDILPPGDSVGVKRDTIIEIASYPMTPFPVRSSENIYEPASGRLMVIGQQEDSIFGTTRASIMTQVNTTNLYLRALNTEIDSMRLSVQVFDYLDDRDQDFIIRVYELTEPLYMDTTYYSDHETAGAYDPAPITEFQYSPDGSEILEIPIEDRAFMDHMAMILSDTLVMENDSLFKEHFNGFYLTAESLHEQGDFVQVQLNAVSSGLDIHYRNDSTRLDLGEPWKWVKFGIDPVYSQKIQIHEHDYTGTRLESYLDDPLAMPGHAWVQGMNGVNTRLSLSSLADWISDTSEVIISSATLVFEVVPEEESGVLYEDLPERLMLFTALPNDSMEYVYDHLVNMDTPSAFGGYKKAVSDGLFDTDTTYRYSFNMGLHFQYMVDGEKTDNDFILQVSNQMMDPASSLLRAAHPSKNTGLRMEIVYLEL